MATKKTKVPQYKLFCNERYGIYAGLEESYDPVTRVAVVRDCRHVARWYGKTGGITSLAAHGLCGPNAGDSRIGAPTTDASGAGATRHHPTTACLSASGSTGWRGHGSATSG